MCYHIRSCLVCSMLPTTDADEAETLPVLELLHPLGAHADKPGLCCIRQCRDAVVLASCGHDVTIWNAFDN